MNKMDPESQRRRSDNGVYTPLLRDRNNGRTYESIYDRPLPCCGCGIGWCSFLTGFLFPLTWYYGTYLFFTENYRDPRERPGLAACAIARPVSKCRPGLWLESLYSCIAPALVITVAAVVTVIALMAEHKGYTAPFTWA